MKNLKIFSALLAGIAGECDLANVQCDITTGFTLTINQTCRGLDYDHVSFENNIYNIVIFKIIFSDSFEFGGTLCLFV